MRDRRERCTFAGSLGYNADDDNDNAKDDNVSDDGDGTMGDDLDDDGNGVTGDDVDQDGNGTAYDNIDDDCNAVTGNEVDNEVDGAKLPSSSMCRHLRRRHDSVVALVMMASLPSQMRRRLAIVNNDGNGMMGDNDYDDFDNGVSADVQASCRCR